jgi:hypothetical protein
MDSQIDSDDGGGMVGESLEERAGRLQEVREELNREPNKRAYTKKFDIEVGEVLIEDRSTSEQRMVYKAEAKEEDQLAEHPADAVIGLMTKLMEGDL